MVACVCHDSHKTPQLVVCVFYIQKQELSPHILHRAEEGYSPVKEKQSNETSTSVFIDSFLYEFDHCC